MDGGEADPLLGAAGRSQLVSHQKPDIRQSKWHEVLPGMPFPASRGLERREAWSVEERRPLLRLVVELWERADELECRRSSGVSPGHE